MTKKSARQLDAEIAKELRAKITEDGGDVVIEYYDDLEDRRVRRRFSAPLQRVGYVREIFYNGDDGQVCERLYHTGNTLRASADTLPQVIRREWRKRQRQQDD
jgi:hypothetical protein